MPYPLALAFTALLFLGVTVFYARQRCASIYHPITLYLAFHGLVFVVRPIVNAVNGSDFIYRNFSFYPSDSTRLLALLVVNLGLLAFVFGCLRTGSTPLVFRQGPVVALHRRQLLKPFAAVMLLLAPIAAYSLATVASGWSTMTFDMQTGTAINTTANGWMVEAQLMLMPLTVLFAWIFRFRLVAMLPLIAFVAARAATGGRGPAVVACVAAGLLWLFDRKRRWPTPRMVALGCAMLIAFHYVGQDRGASIRQVAYGAQEEERFRPSTGIMEGMDFANREFVEYLVDTVPAKTGSYDYFVNILQIFTEPIPRVWWPSKPVGPPIKFYDLGDYHMLYGMTGSLPGMGWTEFGLLGVLIWCGLWGLVLGHVYKRFATSGQGNFAVALYFAFLPIFVVAYRDGVLVSVLRSGVFYLAPVLGWALAARAMGLSDHPRPKLQLATAELGPAAQVRAPRRSPAPAVVPRAWRPKAATAGVVPRAWRRPPQAPPGD